MRVPHVLSPRLCPRSRGVAAHSVAAEVAAGLGLYFNKALGNNLLYRFERGQYQEQYKLLQGTDKQMSSVYGGEHLLRLFGASPLSLHATPCRPSLMPPVAHRAVNLPELLAHTSLDPEAMSELKDHIQQFLQCVVARSLILLAPR